MLNNFHPGSALITGGAKRGGRAISLKLAKLGYNVAIHYNTSASEAKQLSRKIESLGRRCILLKGDLSKTSDVSKLVAKAKKAFPDLNLLINNASVFKKSLLPSATLQDFDRDLNIHLKAPFILTSDFAKICGQGQIINLLDTNIIRYKSTHFTYLLSKKALAEFTKMSAVALGPKIRVNGIAPGLTITPEGQSPEFLKSRSQRVPLQKTGSPELIADCVEFLIKNTFLSGEIIFCDGGERLV